MLQLQRHAVRVTGSCSALFSIFSRGFSNKTPESEDPNATAQATNQCNNNFCGTSAADRRGVITVGIIGGGWAPVYTAVLLKQMQIIRRIHIVDTKDDLSGAIFDAGHIDTSAKIKYFRRKYIVEALREVDIVALMDETDFDMGKAGPIAQFMVTSSYIRKMAEKMVQACPTALAAVFARPVTAALPLVSEVYKCAGWWDPDRIIGSLALDTMRMEAITANLLDLNPAFMSIPIVGGADACSVVPLLSRARPVNQFTKAQGESLVRRLRSSDKELANTEQKGPKLSMGAAAAKLINTLAGGCCGYKNAVTSAFVRSDVLPLCRFFATELQFGPGGVQKNFGLPKVSPIELCLVEQAIPLINEQVDMALSVIHGERKAKLKA